MFSKKKSLVFVTVLDLLLAILANKALPTLFYSPIDPARAGIVPLTLLNSFRTLVTKKIIIFLYILHT